MLQRLLPNSCKIRRLQAFSRAIELNESIPSSFHSLGQNVKAFFCTYSFHISMYVRPQ